jgi:hypothetical protein
MCHQDLAQWYLRFNGCLTVTNFIVHPRSSGSQRAEIDIVAVRFPRRQEFDNDDQYDAPFKDLDRVLFLIAEAKRGCCDLNEATRLQCNIAYVLKSLSPVDIEKVDAVAQVLKSDLTYCDGNLSCCFMCFGDRKSEDLQRLSIYQNTWDEVLGFVWKKFSEFASLKTDHEQWDETGKTLWNLWRDNSCSTEAAFIDVCKKRFGISQC